MSTTAGSPPYPNRREKGGCSSTRRRGSSSRNSQSQDTLAAYTVLLDDAPKDGPDEKRTRLILGIPRQELKDVYNQKIAFFSKGVFLDCQRPDFLPENLSLIVSLVDSPHFLLQINRERFGATRPIKRSASKPRGTSSTSSRQSAARSRG